MKKQLTRAIAALGLVVFGLTVSACSNVEPTGMHRMGPPGKTKPMSDSAMPSRAQ